MSEKKDDNNSHAGTKRKKISGPIPKTETTQTEYDKHDGEKIDMHIESNHKITPQELLGIKEIPWRHDLYKPIGA